MLLRRKHHATFGERTDALSRFITVIHRLKLCNINKVLSFPELARGIQWIAGKYDPDLLKK